MLRFSSTENHNCGDFTLLFRRRRHKILLKRVHAARAARLFCLCQPMTFLICVLIVSITVGDAKALSRHRVSHLLGSFEGGNGN